MPEGQAVAAVELRRGRGRTFELIDHLALGDGHLADLDREAELLRRELHRHLADPDLAGEGMVVAVAALGRVTERQQPALVAARQVLHPCRTVGRSSEERRGGKECVRACRYR